MKKISLLVISLLSVMVATTIAQSSSCCGDKGKTETSVKTGCGNESLSTSETKVEVETVALKPWNTICPVMGEEVDTELETVEYDGKLFGFCCESCVTKFKENPEKYAKRLSEDGTKLKTSK